MEKALRRQLGADAVDIDTRASTCRVAFAKPQLLDLERARSAANDANYVLTSVTLEASGVVVEGPCADCETTVHYLKLPETGQLFELAEALPLGPIELKASIEGWKTVHPRLLVQ